MINTLMRLKEILNESITFAPARLKIENGRKIFSLADFEKATEKPCWVCDGTGEDKYASEFGQKYSCEYCKGRKVFTDYEMPVELNVSNANAQAIIDMLGLEFDYSGYIPPERMPELRRKLIKLKNGEIDAYTKEPTKQQGPVRRYKDDDGMDRIGRGATVYDFGRSNEQVKRYIDKLLELLDFAQKNDAIVTWG